MMSSAWKARRQHVDGLLAVVHSGCLGRQRVLSPLILLATLCSTTSAPS
jgi:hypothetical protein